MSERMIDMTKDEISCPICHNNIFIEEIYNKRYDAYFRKCTCGICYRIKYDLNKIYTQYDFDSVTRIEHWHDVSIKSALRYYNKLISIVPYFNDLGYSVFEFGTSLGYFLNLMKEKGWKVGGIEISKRAVDYAKEKFGINIYNEDIENFKIDNTYDLVATFEVIEHLVDVDKFIKKVYNMLNENGIFVFCTPNLNAPSTLFNNESEAYHCGHMILFNYNTIKKLLNDNNLNVIGVSQESNHFESWESMMIICSKRKI